MGMGSESLDGNGNDMGRNLEIEWEMGMLVWEIGRNRSRPNCRRCSDN